MASLPPTSTSPFEEGRTCWKTARAERVALLTDNSAYFAAALSAIQKAEKSIMLLGWGFDPRTRLWPDHEIRPDAADEIGVLLNKMAAQRPDLDIRLLIWKSALPVSISQDFFPHRSKAWFEKSPVRFMLDAAVPFGACHHQKVLVIDDAVAFCGGGDICVDRWDSPAHLDDEPRRIMPNGHCHAPRHEVMMVVDGEAARSLGELARRRWKRATTRRLPPPPPQSTNASDPWPDRVVPDFTGVDIAIARTEPAWNGAREVREIENLHLEAIAQAKTSIYLENQYFTSPVIAEALSRRLTEPDGPEVVLISTAQSPSYFDQATMDRTRSQALRRIAAADVYGRFRAFCPLTRDGGTIIVHAKVAVIDDRILRVGSANLNNRSAGFDTECDLALEAADEAQSRAIARFRAQEIGHFLGHAPSAIEEMTRERGLVAAFDHARGPGASRMLPLKAQKLDPVSSFIADHHLGDPLDPHDAWRPFLRRMRMQRRLARLGLRLARTPTAAIDAKVDHQG